MGDIIEFPMMAKTPANQDAGTLIEKIRKLVADKLGVTIHEPPTGNSYYMCSGCSSQAFHVSTDQDAIQFHCIVCHKQYECEFIHDAPTP